VQLARRGYVLWNAGGVEAMLEHVLAPDIVLHDLPDLPDTGIFRGAEEVASRFRTYLEPLGHFQIEVRSLEGRGDYTLASAEIRAEGSSSGAAVTMSLFHVCRWTSGRMSEMRTHLDADRARLDYERLSAVSDRPDAATA
jgi:hypothetical protein